MANYLCEEKAICTNFQSAICLHCSRRLCLLHINEHNQLVFRDVEHVSNELEQVFQHIQQDLENNKITCANVLSSLNEWRIEHIKKIEQIYEHQLKSMTSQQESFEHMRQQLLQKLEQNGRQQLQLLRTQNNANIDVLHHIQQTITDARKENEALNCVLPALPTVRIESHDSSVSTTTTTGESMSSTNELIPRKKTEPKLSSTNAKHGINCRPLRRLIDMFAHTSSIGKSKNDIKTYVQKQERTLKFPVLVCSYLTAWHRKMNIDEKVFLLNEHISTIQQYMYIRHTDFDILIGIQAFFLNAKIYEQKHPSNLIFRMNRNRTLPAEEMMIFLLQFFLNHQCINEDLVLRWYHNQGIQAYKGFSIAHPLATPFINSIMMKRTDDNHDATSTNHVNIEQRFDVPIKDEPVAFQ